MESCDPLKFLQEEQLRREENKEALSTLDSRIAIDPLRLFHRYDEKQGCIL
jgi:hypothetical protein